ncbi:DUF4382 domain-containing protein [Chloroflexota bacterium]
MLKSKFYLLIAISSMLALLVAACAQPVSPTKPKDDGTIIIYVTDAAPDDEVKSIIVTLSEIQVHKAAVEQEPESASTNNQTQAWEQEQQSLDEEGEWIIIDTSGNATFDLLQIKGIEQFLGTREVEAAKYTQVRLVIETIQVKVGSGNLTYVTLPSKELKIIRSFNVVASETTALVLDFEADKMVTLPKTGETATLGGVNKITVRPVVNLIVRQGQPYDEN